VTGFLGPAVLAAVTALTASQRIGMATVLVFLAIGALILATVREDQRTKG
jgi:UMF1 family MFS transporter